MKYKHLVFKVLLVLDNVPGHPHKLGLAHPDKVRRTLRFDTAE
jgi:hypothetical protein